MSSPEGRHEAALDEVLDALRERPGEGEAVCALCRRTLRSVERGLKSFFAEFVNDPQVRDRWRGARGFCPAHAALAAQSGDALAIAILYSDLARLVRERWEGGAAGNLSEGRLRLLSRGRRARGEPALPCPACTLEREAERRYTAALAAGLRVATGAAWDALEQGDGLCVAHIEQVMEAADPVVAARLRRREAQRLAALQAELEEIVRKNDYRFRSEPWGSERDAWLRALAKLRRPTI